MPAVLASRVWHKAAFAVTAWLCLCHLPVAVCWSCSLTMTGHPGTPQNLSLAQTALHCTPDAGEFGTLPVYFSDKLLNRSLQGHYSDLSFVAEDVAAASLHCVTCQLTPVYHRADARLHACRCSSLRFSCWAQ